DLATILQFARDTGASDLEGACWRRERLVLGTTQQHVPALRTFDAGLEPPGSIQEHDAAAVLRAAMEQRRAEEHVAEADDRTEVQEGDAQARLALHRHPQRIVVEMEVGPLRRHIERVQELVHRPGTASSPSVSKRAARQARSRAGLPTTAGKHASWSEQCRQRASLTAGGMARSRSMARTAAVVSSTCRRSTRSNATSRRARDP